MDPLLSRAMQVHLMRCSEILVRMLSSRIGVSNQMKQPDVLSTDQSKSSGIGTVTKMATSITHLKNRHQIRKSLQMESRETVRLQTARVVSRSRLCLDTLLEQYQ